jgi:hypothetical protein
VYDLSLLEHYNCDLCKLLFKALEKKNIKPPGIVKLHQNGAVVGVENGSNLLSIYVEPGMWNPFVEYNHLTNITYYQAQISHKEHNSASPSF